MRGATLQALANPIFRRYWTSNIVSLSGNWMQGAAQSWLVLNNLFPHDSALGIARLGQLGALQFAPSLIFSLFAGALLDRVSRRMVLQVTQTVLMGTAATLAFFIARGTVTFEIVALMALISGTASAFDMTARQSIVPSLVPREHMPNAVALNSLAFNTARVTGGALFGALAPFLGLAAIFAINAASFLVVLWALLALPNDRAVVARHTSVLSDIREGLTYVRRTPAVLGPILLLGALSVTAMNFNTIIPTFARYVLQAGEGTFGLLTAAVGMGAVTAALWQAAVSDRVPPARRLTPGGTLLGVAVLGLAFAPGVVPALLALAVGGAGMILTAVSANSTVQLAVPDALRGRVMSVYSLVFIGSSPFGALLTSTLMSSLGPRVGIAVAAALALVAVVALRPAGGRSRVVAPEIGD